MTPASIVSCAREVVRIRIVLSVTIVPATTTSPTFFGTGRDSPVIIDSSNDAKPFSTTPSKGMISPAKTLKRDPLGTNSTGDTDVSSLSMTVAVFG